MMITLHNIRRRIETLERSSSGQRDALQGIGERALGWLWPNQVELVIAADGADRVSCPLTESEASARRAYTEALERECRWAGLAATAASGLTIDLHQATIRMLAYRFSDEDLRLCRSGSRAIREGREANERESAAIRAHNSELERLSQLAGFGSLAEFYAFGSLNGV
jgi:hypothetical protein